MRDGHKCVVCGAKASDGFQLDAHHILERRLFSDGGYYLNNGATLCDRDGDGCHMKAETTKLTVEDIRYAAGIKDIIVPEHMYDDTVYDKWGNPCLPNGLRLKGELFHDESVQKVIAEYLDIFTDQVKYPRTLHAPWSQSVNDDDRVLKDMSVFENKRVIVTEKEDGENTSVYHDYIHARSIDGRSHPSRDWVKQFASTWQFEIPRGWRVCGENLYAKHSIHYTDLPSYFMGFSIWNERNECMAWDETVEYFDLFGVVPVPVLYDGIYDEAKIKALWDESKRDITEGYVIRLADSFQFRDFKKSVAKFVRRGHIATTQHWMHGQAIVPNGLANS